MEINLYFGFETSYQFLITKPFFSHAHWAYCPEPFSGFWFHFFNILFHKTIVLHKCVSVYTYYRNVLMEHVEKCRSYIILYRWFNSIFQKIFLVHNFKSLKNNTLLEKDYINFTMFLLFLNYNIATLMYHYFVFRSRISSEYFDRSIELTYKTSCIKFLHFIKTCVLKNKIFLKWRRLDAYYVDVYFSTYIIILPEYNNIIHACFV